MKGENRKQTLNIGILTHYYKSQNYGGNLQAYALCRVLASMGYKAEQIQYNRNKDATFWKTVDRSRTSRIKRVLHKLCNELLRKPVVYFYNRKIADSLNTRKSAIVDFNNQTIPHSQKIYTADDMREICDTYDIFITGSDQVWHPMAVCEAYLLDFADGQKHPKFSYAASVATDELTDVQRLRYKRSLADYQAISVREEQAVNLIQPIAEVPVKQVLDPVLLLSSEQWDDIVSNRIVAGKYLFCYFLGDDVSARTAAKDYAQTHNLEIVTLPHLQGVFRSCDAHFGDKHLYDISPMDFLSLVKYAEYVFTDSFHAVAFSLVYKKQFAVFARGAMGSRIHSLLNLVDLPERFVNAHEQKYVEYIETLKPIDYSQEFVGLTKQKNVSIDYLIDNMALAEEKVRYHEN